jgi:hypothetical protein
VEPNQIREVDTEMISFILREVDGLPEVRSYYTNGIVQIYLKPHQIPYFDTFNNGAGVYFDIDQYHQIISIEILHSKEQWKIDNNLFLPALLLPCQAIVKELPDITTPFLEEIYYNQKDSILLVRFPDIVQINASFLVADNLIYSLDSQNRLAGIWLENLNLNDTIDKIEFWLLS